MMNEDMQPEKVKIENWTFRIKKPSEINDQTKLMLLLHGYMGNENVMWILANPLPETYVFIAPRAPVKIGLKQYAWHKITPQWPSLAAYKQKADQLLERIELWMEDNPGFNNQSFDVMGFSQGAVMAYALAFLYPERINKVASIASFIPESWKSEINREAITGKSFFIAHGTKDEIIPITRASKSVDWLSQNGADVNFCKAEIGHKISANCFEGLGDFFIKTD